MTRLRSPSIDQHVAGDGDPHLAVLLVEVRDGVVLGGAVVPHRHIALGPGPADGVLELGDPVLEQLKSACDSAVLRPTKFFTKWPSTSARSPVSGTRDHRVPGFLNWIRVNSWRRKTLSLS